MISWHQLSLDATLSILWLINDRGVAFHPEAIGIMRWISFRIFPPLLIARAWNLEHVDGHIVIRCSL